MRILREVSTHRLEEIDRYSQEHGQCSVRFLSEMANFIPGTLNWAMEKLAEKEEQGEDWNTQVISAWEVGFLYRLLCTFRPHYAGTWLSQIKAEAAT